MLELGRLSALIPHVSNKEPHSPQAGLLAGRPSDHREEHHSSNSLSARPHRVTFISVWSGLVSNDTRPRHNSSSLLFPADGPAGPGDAGLPLTSPARPRGTPALVPRAPGSGAQEGIVKSHDVDVTGGRRYTRALVSRLAGTSPSLKMKPNSVSQLASGPCAGPLCIPAGRRGGRRPTQTSWRPGYPLM